MRANRLGAHGTAAVGNTRRRLSFFVMVLAYSRQMFVEFTVSQTMEHSLLATSTPSRPWGCRPKSWSTISSQRFFSAWPEGPGIQSTLSGLRPAPRLCDRSLQCRPRQREGPRGAGVGYVKNNFLRGLELNEFSAIQAAAQAGSTPLPMCASTGRRSGDPWIYLPKRQHLRPPNPHSYDISRIYWTTVASARVPALSWTPITTRCLQRTLTAD